MDLMALLTSPGSTPGVPALPGLAVGREEAGFDAVLDQVVAQIASLLVPGAPVAPAPSGSLGFAPPSAPANPDSVVPEGDAVAPNPTVPGSIPAPAILAPSTGASVAEPPAVKDLSARNGREGSPSVADHDHVAPRNLPTLVERPPKAEPMSRDETTRVVDPTSPGDADTALIAVIRAGLGLPSAVTPNPAPTPVVPTTPEHEMPEQAVAVGRTGVMPTRPEHAHAAVVTPPGIARRFPISAPPAPVTPAPVDPETPPVAPDAVVADAVVQTAPADPTASAAPAAPVIPDAPAAPAAPNWAPQMSKNDTTGTQFATAADAPVAVEAPNWAPQMSGNDITGTQFAPEVPVVAPVVVDELANWAQLVSPEDTTRARLPDAGDDLASRLQATVLQSMREAFATVEPQPVAATDVEMTDVVEATRPLPTPPVAVAVSPQPVDEVPNDIAIPDVAPTGVPVEQDVKAEANAVHTPLPVFDTSAPTQEERLSAIAPPLISNADDPADKDDTSDTIVAPLDDAPPQAAAVNQSDRATRPDAGHRADRNERTHEANGLAAPLRAALRERMKRDENFTLTVRLDPPELGVVRVRVFTQGDNVKITLHAENPDARAALQQRHDDVRDLLRNEGFNLDGFDVESHDERRQSNDQPNRRRANATASTAEFAAPSEDDGALRL